MKNILLCFTLSILNVSAEPVVTAPILIKQEGNIYHIPHSGGVRLPLRRTTLYGGSIDERKANSYHKGVNDTWNLTFPLITQTIDGNEVKRIKKHIKVFPVSLGKIVDIYRDGEDFGSYTIIIQHNGFYAKYLGITKLKNIKHTIEKGKIVISDTLLGYINTDVNKTGMLKLTFAKIYRGGKLEQTFSPADYYGITMYKLMANNGKHIRRNNGIKLVSPVINMTQNTPTKSKNTIIAKNVSKKKWKIPANKHFGLPLRANVLRGYSIENRKHHTYGRTVRKQWHTKLKKLVPRRHDGYDFLCEIGTAIYSMGDGKIIAVENKANGYGLSVTTILDLKYNTNNKHTYTFMAHLSKIGKNIKVGSIVTKKTIIGYCGDDGYKHMKNTPKHLHFEISNGVQLGGKKNGILTKRISPYNVIGSKNYDALLHGKTIYDDRNNTPQVILAGDPGPQ